MIKRVMLGRKIETKNGLDFYLYPQRKLTEEEKNSSLNIMVIGDTGSGKSTWLQCLLNYLQEIQLEEDERYYLFDEKALLDEYQNKNGSKFPSFSKIEKPTIYNIEPNKLVYFFYCITLCLKKLNYKLIIKYLIKKFIKEKEDLT